MAVAAHRRAALRKRASLRVPRRLWAELGARSRAIGTKFTWWELTLFLLGVLATLSVLGALFMGAGREPPRVYTEAAPPPVSSLAFSLALAGLVGSPIDHGGSVKVLNNGDAFRSALLQSLEQAKRSVNFSVYVWKGGKFSDAILDTLVRKQRGGIAVRILLDDFGATAVSDKTFEPLEQAGGKVQKFRTVKFGQLTRFHRRNHRRSIVVDGQVGFTGGMAVADIWLGNAEDPDHWRDVMFQVTGPLARSLQSAFVDTWVGSSGELLIGPEMYPTDLNASGGIDRFIPIANSPADDDQSMAYFFLLPVLAAQRHIYVATPYFIPDPPLLRALEDKARAGIDVRLLLPGRHTDNWIARASSQSRYASLLEAGVKIYEYQPTFVHSKYAVIDDEWSIIGSPNVNSRSRQLDEENAFGVLDKALGGELRSTFLADLDRAVLITPAQWRQRSALMRAFQFLSQVLDQQS